MSQENVEIARRALEAATRTPKPDFATVNALFHPEHVLVDRIYDTLEGDREWVGAEGSREHMAMREELWAGFAITIHSGRALDEERVLLVGSIGGRGHQSGAPFEVERGWLITVRDGRVVRTEVHLSPEAALEAAGLSE